jgi:hypothetical protein
MTFKEFENMAKEYDSYLRADDKRFRYTSFVRMQDGAQFKIPDAFIMKDETYFVVFAEHYRFICFEKDMATTYIQQHTYGPNKGGIVKIEKINPAIVKKFGKGKKVWNH